MARLKHKNDCHAVHGFFLLQVQSEGETHPHTKSVLTECSLLPAYGHAFLCGNDDRISIRTAMTGVVSRRPQGFGISSEYCLKDIFI